LAATPSQKYAGLTEVILPLDAGVATFRTGKQYGAITIEMTLPDGTMAKAHATSVEAFTGQAISAAAVVRLQQELAAMGVQMSAAMTQAVTRALLGGVAP
jgi:hypothetical protein